jgi:uncharacterized protein (DUF934 family)
MLKIVAFHEQDSLPPTHNVLALPNDADPTAVSLDGVQRIDLHFPKFTDGRAYSQAHLLRRRLGFQGEIRATGDVLIDQLVHMARTGFSVAVLREGVDKADAQRQFDRFQGFYQGDIVHPAPHFAAPLAGRTAARPTATAPEAA